MNKPLTSTKDKKEPYRVFETWDEWQNENNRIYQNAFTNGVKEGRDKAINAIIRGFVDGYHTKPNSEFVVGLLESIRKLV